MAMLVVAISVVLVSGAFLRQTAMARQVENEASISQAKRLLEGAVDWVRVILKEDGRTSATDHPGEAWAVSLEQTRLDQESGDPAWVSGAIEDAQSRFNLRNLSGPDGPIPGEVSVLTRLLGIVGAEPALADRIAIRVHRAVTRTAASAQGGILPTTVDDLEIEDADERDALARLRPFIALIPMQSAINANTAPAEVLAACFDNLPLVDARRLVESRGRAAFRDLSDLATRLPERNLSNSNTGVAVATQFFFVRGFAEFRQVRVQALALLWRHDGRVDIVWAREEAA
jgi:general secretion pathway protein K